MAVRQRGETVILTLDIYNQAGSLVNPSDTPIVTITDPNGEVVEDAEDMTNVDTGQYEFSHTLDEAAPLGWWTVRYTVVDSTLVTIADDGFEVQP